VDNFEVRLANTYDPQNVWVDLGFVFLALTQSTTTTTITTLQQVLKGDPGPQGPVGPTGPAVAALDDVADVNVTSVQPNDFLTWNGSVWVAAPLDGGTFN
jgi:hypothetical protein